MHQSNAGSGQQDNIVIPKRKISLFHNMKFNGTILEEQAAAHAAAAAAAEQQKKEFGLNPNAPSFNMQQYAAHRYVLNRLKILVYYLHIMVTFISVIPEDEEAYNTCPWRLP